MGIVIMTLVFIKKKSDFLLSYISVYDSSAFSTFAFIYKRTFSELFCGINITNKIAFLSDGINC